MPQTQVKQANTVVQGEFVDAAAGHWQQRRNGAGFTFRAELHHLEGRLNQQFTGLHRHVSQNHTSQQSTLAESFTCLDQRLLGRFQSLDRKLNALLMAQRQQAARRLTLWLMAMLAILGTYVLLVHPLLRPAKPVMPTITPSQNPIAPPPAPQPIVPLPHEIPAN